MAKRGRPAKAGKKGIDVVNVLLALVGVFLLYMVIKRIVLIIQKNKDNQVDEIPGSKPGDIATTPIPKPEPSLDIDKWLKRGDKGREVTELQKLMNADIDKINKGRNKVYAGTFIPAYPKLVIDGIFGSKTEAALVEITSLNLGAGKGIKQTSIRRYKEIVAMPNK